MTIQGFRLISLNIVPPKDNPAFEIRRGQRHQQIDALEFDVDRSANSDPRELGTISRGSHMDKKHPKKGSIKPM